MFGLKTKNEIEENINKTLARLSHRVGGGRRRLDGLLGPHRSNVDNGTASAALDHVARHTLGYEERASIQV